MKKTLKKIQDMMMAVTFAEAGEWDTAREIMPEVRRTANITWFDKIFTAVTFAESGLYNEALNMIEPREKGRGSSRSDFSELGIPGAHLAFGTIDC